MNKTFSIVIDAVTKGFDKAKSVITDAIGGGAKLSRAEMTALLRETRSLEDEVKTLQATLKKADGFEKLTASTQTLYDKWQAAEQKTNDLADAIRNGDGDLRKLNAAFKVSSAQSETLRERFEKKENSLRNLNNTLEASGVDVKNLSASQATLSKRLEEARQKIDKNKAAFAAAKKPTVGFFQKSSAAAKAFNEKMRNGRTATSKFGNMIKTVLAGAGIKAVVSGLFSAGTEVQRLDRSFAAAAGSVKAGGEELAFVRKISNDLGQEFYSLAGSYKSLYAASKGTNLEGEATRKIFIGITEASTALGLGTEQATGMLKALEQMMSKGNVQAEELRGQLGERLPGAFNIAAAAMGVSTTELNDMLDRGEVLAEDLLPKLATALHEKYGQAALDASDDAQQGLNRFISAWKDLKAQIAESGFMDVAVEKLKELTATLKDPETIEKVKDLAKMVVWLGDTVVTAAINWGKWIAGFAAVTGAVKIVSSMVATVKALNAAFQAMTSQKVAGFFLSLKDYAAKAVVRMAALAAAIGATTAALTAMIALPIAAFFIGQMEPVQRVVQSTYAKIDKFFTNVKIKYLELKKLWNEIFDDDAEVAQIEKAITAEKRHIQSIDILIDRIKNQGKEAKKTGAVEVAATEKTAADKTKVNDNYFETLGKARAAELDTALANLKKETDARSIALNQQIADIELAVARREITESEGAGKILAMEKQAAQARIQTIKDALADEEFITGDAYDQRADLRADLGKQLAAAELAFTQVQIKEASARTKAVEAAEKEQIAAVQAADKEKALSATELFAVKKAAIEQETLLAGQNLDLQYQKIRDMEIEDVIDHEEAVKRKTAADKDFAAKKLAIAKKAVAAAKELYGEESAAYIVAVEKMKKAAEELADIEIEVEKRRKKAKKSYGSVVAYYVAQIKDEQKSYTELMATIASLGGRLDMLADKYDIVAHQNRAARHALIDLQKEFLATRKQAEKLTGVKWDISNMSLDEISDGARAVLNDFKRLGQTMAETYESVNKESAVLEAWRDGVDDAATAVDDFAGKSAEYRTAINSLFDDQPKDLARIQAGIKDVETAYKDLVASGKAAVGELKSQWEDLAGKIDEIEQKIKGLSSDTEDEIRELQRGLMTDEQEWLDKRLEAHDLYAQAVRELDQGNYDNAVDLFEQAADVAKDLAVEVKDATGNVVSGLEKNTAESISLIEKIAAAEKRALITQQDQLIKNQKNVGDSLDQTFSKLKNLSTQAGQFKNFDLDDYIPPAPKFATGGVIRGRSHANGGELIEVEGGELFISRLSTNKLITDYGPGTIESLLAGKIPKFDAGGLVSRALANIPAVPKYDSGGLVSGPSIDRAGVPSKTVRVQLDLGPAKKYTGIFPEPEADGLVRALGAAKQISM